MRGVEDNQKRYLITLAGRNLTLLMRVLFGIGTPRSLQGLSAAFLATAEALAALIWTVVAGPHRFLASLVYHCRQSVNVLRRGFMANENPSSSTGC